MPTHDFDIAPMLNALVVADDIVKRQQLGKVLSVMFSMCDVTINPKYTADVDRAPETLVLGGVTYARQDIEASKALSGS